MLDFRTPTLEDKERIDSFVRKCGQIGCDVSFTNTFIWRQRYDIRVAFDDDTYYKAYAIDGKISGYAAPVTKGDLRKAIDTVVADARERGVEPLIGLLSDANAELLRHMYADKVRITEDRDSFDYIYERENLATLGGKKYHAKRNHIARFMRNCENYSVKELCKENLSDAMSVAERWLDGDDDHGEMTAIREAFQNFDTLGMFGLILYVDDRAVAMCAASEINDCVCDVNFEKAVEVDGAYSVINNEFAKHFSKYTLVNREEDMGLEGLRKAKLSYHPDILYRKSIAVFE